MRSVRDITTAELARCGLDAEQAESMVATLTSLTDSSPRNVWQQITRDVLRPYHPPSVHELIYDCVFADWDAAFGPAPAWFPDKRHASNIDWLMAETGAHDYRALHAWSVAERDSFWELMIKRLGVRFRKPPASILDMPIGAEHPRWLRGARLNIVESCLDSPVETHALITGGEDVEPRYWHITELRTMVGQVARGLLELGINTGDRVALHMPMTAESVAIYLGAIAIGCPVVTIADSFAPAEIEVRLNIGMPRLVFTQDFVRRNGKRLPLYEKLHDIDVPRAVVAQCDASHDVDLRSDDLRWHDFLSARSDLPITQCDPADSTTILFSSGTTGAPKAIPWDHTTPIKAAVDAHLHHDIHPGDVLCWPSNMGWMMGPWLVYASLLNRSAIALYDGVPTTRGFAKFVQDARVTMLGVVPSLVSAWRSSGSLDGLNWSHIRAFSSTGECSNPRDMLFLMSQAGYKPVIEYCGGTEIGGGYITGTVVQPSAPSTFSTPALGVDLVVLDEEGNEATEGEVFLVPPSMGLSRELLNADHHEVYFANTPQSIDGRLLRRHGDRMQRFANGYFRAHGRADDTMNLGGIKVSSLQIEEVVTSAVGVRESAAIAVSPADGGPERLVVFAVLTDDRHEREPAALRNEMQHAIRSRLNPLFKLHDVVVVKSLPRTASNKVMRRELRRAYKSPAS